ncbi:MAG: hypothetical protein JWL86_421 [Rhizobium sp.]|nr:hypothetical protein [Rhizobium sp.]
MDDADLSKASFSIAYNGDGRADDHTMDVELLAPALLGFGKLIREANSEINGDRAKANVRVISDFEHKCFQINFETVLTYYEQIKTFLETADVQSAKNVLEWVGILGSPPAALGMSLLAYLKYRKGRKVESARQITDESGQGKVQVIFEGDGRHIEVHQHVYNLAENPKALKATREAMSPVGIDGFSRIELREADKTVELISAPDADAIIASCNVELPLNESAIPEPDVTTAWLSVYAPVYDERAERWRFSLGTEHVYADISETTIAKDALSRGGAMADDAYQVRLEISYSDADRAKPSYKILEVLRFIAAPPRMVQTEIEGLPARRKSAKTRKKSKAK